MTYRTFDRIPEFDERSRQFPVRTLFATAPKPLRSYTWRCETYLDQGQEGACVGFGISHEAAARPVVRSVTEADAFSVYREAQKLDEWDGEAYSGTSVLAGMKAATARGWYAEYRWAFSLEDVLLALGYKGPVVIGVNWHEGMFEPDGTGYLHASGAVLGGHCTLLKGVRIRRTAAGELDLDASSVVVHNSWGKNWGVGGTARLTLRDLDRLLNDNGEACVPVTRR